MNKYDVAVIGSGPGGYVAAIRCSQLGMKTAIIEKYQTLGGTCLNVGCIPSKALLDSSEHFHNAKNNFSDHGIDISELKVNISKMISRKDQVVSQTCDGINFLMKKNKIDVYHGIASFSDSKHINILKSDDSTEQIMAEKTVIATGSKPLEPSFVKIDKKRIITSTEALKLKEVPKNLLVIGGGVIGLELGSVYARLGAEVRVIEFQDSILPNMDKSVSKELQKNLKKLGFEFSLSHKVKEIVSNGDIVSVITENAKGESVEFKGDYCLISVGRRPNTKDLNLENIGVEVNDNGCIDTNEYLQTNIPNIYAIGDVVKGPMLAHKSSDEGVFVAEHISGKKPHINYNLIPSVVYTWPEVASVGFTEQQLKSNNKNYKVGSFPIRALGRARASGDIDGLVKVLSDSQTDEVMGVHIISARAADMIGEAVVAMEYRASTEDMSMISHAHPTFSEALKEASLDAMGKIAIHI
ncbi:dihydrolipoyl dehydrogenase [Ichthyobacterium seriolicida]|uniref:Dihydrolipoyl dehydrogenase n=1 Tax=Ichthyobacterium seriolicida TaxID=242600 RepID=A0A1J1EB97_9FLAO|nr:dihydrolipoyl dehydrogenase [Ichthyobacterium seriolicida]BAV95203.1 dihydrolipoamide dehydrogenase [Ichthyobacterium seriolicida]